MLAKHYNYVVDLYYKGKTGPSFPMGVVTPGPGAFGVPGWVSGVSNRSVDLSCLGVGLFFGSMKGPSSRILRTSFPWFVSGTCVSR